MLADYLQAVYDECAARPPMPPRHMPLQTQQVLNTCMLASPHSSHVSQFARASQVLVEPTPQRPPSAYRDTSARAIEKEVDNLIQFKLESQRKVPCCHECHIKCTEDRVGRCYCRAGA